MIKVQGLHKYFNRHKRNEIHVINDINLELPNKGLIVLLGPSGSGKTTLLNVLGGLDKVQSGTIDINNEIIDGYDAQLWDKIRNDHIGYIFQNYNLLPELSVYDNIAFVLKMIGINDLKAIDDRVIYVLKAVGMYPFRKKKALQLSGGQQQRVAIARALVKNPDIIIADEPTGNLDSKNTLEIMNIIKSISKEKLVVLVTHEREMASFYGDRIIELKDGQIIGDQVNHEVEDHALSKDDTIYLKDLKEVVSQQNDQATLAFYADDDQEVAPVSVQLILKNKTLYIKVDSEYQKIKFADASSGVVIKDEAYVKKTREELIQTTFDLETLDHKNIKKERRSMISIKQTLMMAFQKIIRTSRKGKLMLFSFLVAGMVISVTVGLLSAAVIIDPEPYMALPKGYVRVEQKPTYSQMLTFGTDDDDFRIHPFGMASIEFLFPTGDLSGSTIYGQIETSDGVTNKALTHGRLPANHQEIMVSKELAEAIVKGTTGQEFGIWRIDQLFFETLKVGHLELKIVGVVDSGMSLIYMSNDLAAFVQSSRMYLSKDLITNDDLIAGAMPTGNQMVVSLEMYDQIFGSEPSGTFPKTVPMGLTSIVISGVYEIEGLSQTAVLTLENIMERLYNDSYMVYVFTGDTTSLVDRLDLAGYRSSDIYQDAVQFARDQQRIVLISTLTSSAVLIGFAAVGFYFVIRSSLISRIYEISVYRALGVKKSDIFRSFLIEIFVLTTISTLVGYVLAGLALMRLQEGLLGEFNFFKVTPVTFVLGILLSYVINVLAGLLPVQMLLQKTPAQILSQYDI